MKRKLCRWSKQVQIAMIEKDISLKELSKAVHRSPQYMSAVCSQRVRSPITEKLVSDYLNIEDDGKDVYE